MPEKKMKEPARKARSQSSKAGAYVQEEMEHIRQGKHGARSTKQAIAIGLSKARRAGVKVPARRGQKVTKATNRRPNPTRSRAASNALKRHAAISRQVKRMFTPEF
ncbi:MAG: DUF6496 domain-containing protein [Candidatus Sulfopaludibacter sp.]|nr:DUF6496 domain-containing protein [Candidatus Sulfopaludibacter sp.]